MCCTVSCDSSVASFFVVTVHHLGFQTHQFHLLRTRDQKQADANGDCQRGSSETVECNMFGN